ncbi:olfactory receptor 6N2-like [Hyperolius riggenbachi]|uniref:olfactory receptor 6N2-like n=1 Tax=Hyperolius riggenbachi TaxID=752182 RepID=UPI0035A285D1
MEDYLQQSEIILKRFLEKGYDEQQLRVERARAEDRFGFTIQAMQNITSPGVKEFFLVGFASLQKFHNVIFYVVLLAYIICILGNICVIILVRTHATLHTPMYFFITTFAVLEILFVSVTIPKILSVLIKADNSISVIGCFTQTYMLHALGETECFLLALMVFDRYLAINRPLHYSTVMSNTFCYKLTVLPWLAGFIISFIQSICTICLDYCGPNEIDQLFCDMAPLQNLACSDPRISNFATMSAAITTVLCPFIIIAVLYIKIIKIILQIKSDAGKKKAFSTCSSHLIVACMFYCTVIIVYIRPKGSHYDKFLALMYTVVTPMLNPYIYTLRNTEVKNAFKRIIKSLQKKAYK